MKGGSHIKQLIIEMRRMCGRSRRRRGRREESEKTLEQCDGAEEVMEDTLSEAAGLGRKRAPESISRLIRYSTRLISFFADHETDQDWSMN